VPQMAPSRNRRVRLIVVPNEFHYYCGVARFSIVNENLTT
jgi:hypothetical protein